MRYPESNGHALLRSVAWQVSLGPRVPGFPGHDRLRAAIRGKLKCFADETLEQNFEVSLPAGAARCSNLIGVFRRGLPVARSDPGPVLIGTHFDTRLRADREQDPVLRERPIPGANDGGSGTAVLLAALPWLKKEILARDVFVVFFDAEDVGDIAGLPFSFGARRFADNPPVPLPSEVLILDMIGGKNLLLDVDAHVLEHPPSRQLLNRVFGIGRNLGFPAFTGCKLKLITCDHLPFLNLGIASCLLIDLDYPSWHTQADLPAAMSGSSLFMVAEVLRRYLRELRS